MDISPDVYQILVIKQGLKACKVGIRLNKSYTPKHLRRMTERLTGKTFKSRDYDSMIAAIEELLN
jgi:hypothetical protein